MNKKQNLTSIENPGYLWRFLAATLILLYLGTMIVLYRVGITKLTLYRYLAHNGALRKHGKRVLMLLNRSAVKQPLTQAKFTVF
jgi:hypothetical protein